MDAIIKLNAVVKRSHGRFLLRGVDLLIEKERFVQIVGNRYSGKTQLMRLIAGMETADHGNVTVLGTALDELDEEQRAAFRCEHIGYVSARPAFCHSFSMLENTVMPLMLLGRSGVERKTWGEKILTDIGLAHILYVRPKGISDMEARLVALARAFAAEPEIVILDDVFAGIGTAVEKMQKAIMTLSSGSKCSVIFFTQSVESAIPANQIIHIEAGSIRR